MSNYLSSVNTIRFGGLASGIDTESMIRDMMRIEHMKVDRIKQDRQIVEWRQEAYRDITNKLRAFKDDFLDIAKQGNYMLSPNTYRSFKATLTGGSEGALSVSTNADAVAGIYRVQDIQLAEAAKITGNGRTDEIDLNMKLSDFAGEELVIGGSAGEEGTRITITEDMTLRQLMSAINADKDANARLTYSSITGRFVLQSKNTGADAKISISSNKGEGEDSFLEFMGMESSNEATGEDAQLKLTIDNEEYTITSSTNRFTRDGITFDLYDTIDSEITINITEDVDAPFEKIKNFVDSYNELIDDINKKLLEKQHRDFPPLTAEQRETMSEKDIELWEEKAMSGLLRNDPVLERLLYSMRSALIETVEGSDIRLSDIGITTGKWYEYGKLYVDDEKLKNALGENPDKVMELFSKTDGSSYSPDLDAGARAERYRNVGLAHRISDILNDNIRTTRDKNNRKGSLLERAGIVGDTTEFKNVMNDQLSELDKRIDRMNEMLARREEIYWRQFTAMEKAIQDMNSQSMWLFQQLNSGM